MALIERHWGLGHVVPDATLHRYATRTVVAARSDQGRFIVKSYRDDAALGLVEPSVAEIDRRLGIFDYFDESGFGHAPSLRKTVEGERVVREGGLTIYILARIDGAPPPSTPETWAELGRIAASLNARTDYPYDYGIPVAGAIAELTAQAASYPFAKEFRSLVAMLDVLMDQPHALIHGELNPANAILAPAGRLSVLDWDQAGTGPWALELGHPLINVFLSEDLVFDVRSAAAFYGAWAGKSGIDVGRREIIFVAALLHALRYLPFGDVSRRWRRIQHALAHKAELLSVMGGGMS